LPDGLTVFRCLRLHRRRLRTTNALERLHQEIKRLTRGLARLLAAVFAFAIVIDLKQDVAHDR